MLTGSNAQRINQLLGELGDLLDPAYGRREVARAYTAALNTASPDAFAELAEKLRQAANLADRLAEQTR